MAKHGVKLITLRDCFEFLHWLHDDSRMQHRVATELVRRYGNSYNRILFTGKLPADVSEFLERASTFYKKLVATPIEKSYVNPRANDVTDALLECMPKFLAALYFLLYNVDRWFEAVGGGKWRYNYPGWETTWVRYLWDREWGGELQNYLRASGSYQFDVIPGGFGPGEVTYGYDYGSRYGYWYGESMVDDLQKILYKHNDKYNYFRDVFFTTVISKSGLQKSNTANVLALVKTFCQIVIAEKNPDGGSLKAALEKELKSSKKCIDWEELKQHCKTLEQQLGKLFNIEGFSFTGQARRVDELNTDTFAGETAEWFRNNLHEVQHNVKQIDTKFPVDNTRHLNYLQQFATKNIFPYGFIFGKDRYGTLGDAWKTLSDHWPGVIDMLGKNGGGLAELKRILDGGRCRPPAPPPKPRPRPAPAPRPPRPARPAPTQGASRTSAGMTTGARHLGGSLSRGSPVSGARGGNTGGGGHNHRRGGQNRVRGSGAQRDRGRGPGPRGAPGAKGAQKSSVPGHTGSTKPQPLQSQNDLQCHPQQPPLVASSAPGDPAIPPKPGGPGAGPPAGAAPSLNPGSPQAAVPPRIPSVTGSNTETTGGQGTAKNAGQNVGNGPTQPTSQSSDHGSSGGGTAPGATGPGSGGGSPPAKKCKDSNFSTLWTSPTDYCVPKRTFRKPHPFKFKNPKALDIIHEQTKNYSQPTPHNVDPQDNHIAPSQDLSRSPTHSPQPAGRHPGAGLPTPQPDTADYLGGEPVPEPMPREAVALEGKEVASWPQMKDDMQEEQRQEVGKKTYEEFIQKQKEKEDLQKMMRIMENNFNLSQKQLEAEAQKDKQRQNEQKYKDKINRDIYNTMVGNPILSDDASSLPLIQYIDPPLPPKPDFCGQPINDTRKVSHMTRKAFEIVDPVAPYPISEIKTYRMPPSPKTEKQEIDLHIDVTKRIVHDPVYDWDFDDDSTHIKHDALPVPADTYIPKISLNLPPPEAKQSVPPIEKPKINTVEFEDTCPVPWLTQKPTYDSTDIPETELFPSEAPRTVRDMLIWMAGLQNPKHQETLKQCINNAFKRGDDVSASLTLPVNNSSITAKDVIDTIKFAAMFAASVLSAIEPKWRMAVPSVTSASKDPDCCALLCQLRDYVYACCHQLEFLKAQCNRKESEGGWQNCQYGSGLSYPKSPLQAFLTDAPDSKFETHPFDPCNICLKSRVKMGFREEDLPASQQTGKHISTILSPSCGGEDPLLTLSSYLNCLTRRTPRTTGELVSFIHLFGNLLHRHPSTLSTLGSALSTPHGHCPDWDTLKEADLRVIKDIRGSAPPNSNHHDSAHPNTLSTLLGCGITNANCQQLMTPITYRAYALYSPSFAHTYLSWAVYLANRLWESLVKLHCDLEKLQCHDSKSNPLHQCDKALPLLYTHGFTPPDGTLQPSLTCSQFIAKLWEVVAGQPIADLMTAMEAFLYRIRAPFIYTIITLWLTTTLYILHSLLYRMDILCIRSHLFTTRASHLIDVKALLAGSRRMLSLYKDVHYFDDDFHS
ncbi:Ribosome-binding protein 1 [Babesia ovata]|uniref:Ribosome-binding protein 1 n=1 Tax=Babesia ovata TaxID=189622 RepID=A0A2H6KG49_9APIC|nr:Ribosome-binding protein 1 [Babesia ovata]GBE61972.1 Ribosome-binding protein 1 [Babesia ovata]